jgi:GrpB-like predicted nucleotidyltransferase (UPF0157 family)
MTSLNPEQEKWVMHLSDTDKIKIVPYDQDTERKFEKVKKLIKEVLGEDVVVVHRGASSFKISGQNEMDIFIPVPENRMEELRLNMAKVFTPKSIYPKERIKFLYYIDGVKAEIIIVNEASKSWSNGEKFYKYLSNHQEALERYRLLKENGDGLSVREYYRRKMEFINEILGS